MERFIIPAIVGYLLGSIPTGLWVGKVFRGIDVRQHGSGNLGATNVFRVLGWKAGLLTLAVDILKGFVAAWLFYGYDALQPGFELSSMVWTRADLAAVKYPGTASWIAGLAAILGHSFSFLAGFRGGKGVATAAGVFIGVLPMEAGIAITVFLICFVLSRIVSLSSILAAVALAASTIVLAHNRLESIATTLICAFVIWRHRANIQRLVQGTEPRLSFSKAKAS